MSLRGSYSLNVSKNSGYAIPELRRVLAGLLHGDCFNGFRGLGREAVSSIVGDCPIDDCSAVDAFPRIEDQKKIREPF